MIYDIAKQVAAALTAAKVPYAVEYVPTARVSKSILSTPKYLVARDRGTPESFSSPRFVGRMPRMVAVRTIAATVTVLAQSTKVGATVHDHEEQADAMVDRFVAALSEVCAVRKQLVTVRTGTMLSPDECEVPELRTWNGAVYRMTFEVERGVYEGTWTNDPVAVYELSGITNTISTSGGGNGNRELPRATTRGE